MKRINGLRHPGTVLKEDFLEPLGTSVDDLARAIGASPVLLMSLIAGVSPLHRHLAEQLGRYFDTDPNWWTTMQLRWDREARGDDVIGTLSGIVPIKKAS